jgi:hypothetical protein
VKEGGGGGGAIYGAKKSRMVIPMSAAGTSIPLFCCKQKLTKRARQSAKACVCACVCRMRVVGIYRHTP